MKHTVTFVIAGYLLTFTPFLGICIMELYSIYNDEFMQNHLLFVYVFRAVGDTNLYLSSVMNHFIYFYTQSDIRAEIEKLSLLRRVLIALRSRKNSSCRE